MRVTDADYNVKRSYSKREKRRQEKRWKKILIRQYDSEIRDGLRHASKRTANDDPYEDNRRGKHFGRVDYRASKVNECSRFDFLLFCSVFFILM